MWQKLVSWVPFNQGKPKVQAGVLLVIVLLLFGFATQCRAGESRLNFGVGSTAVRGPAPVIEMALRFPKAGPRDADFELGTVFIGESNFEGNPQRNNFAWYGAVIDGFGRFDVGIGPAYLQNTDTYNGSSLNFTLLVGYRFERWNIRLQHFSNGGTRSPNKGRDMLLIRYEF